MADEAEVDPWKPFLEHLVNLNEIIVDHEENPEHELHVGRVVKAVQGQPDCRYVSIWIAGKRWRGFLVEEK